MAVKCLRGRLREYVGSKSFRPLDEFTAEDLDHLFASAVPDAGK